MVILKIDDGFTSSIAIHGAFVDQFHADFHQELRRAFVEVDIAAAEAIVEPLGEFEHLRGVDPPGHFSEFAR
jgi:hypothetical protein